MVRFNPLNIPRRGKVFKRSACDSDKFDQHDFAAAVETEAQRTVADAGADDHAGRSAAPLEQPVIELAAVLARCVDRPEEREADLSAVRVAAEDQRDRVKRMAGVQRNDRVGPVGEQNGRAFFRPAFRQPRIAAGQIVGAVEIEAVRLCSGVAEKADSGFRVELLPEADRAASFCRSSQLPGTAKRTGAQSRNFSSSSGWVSSSAASEVRSPPKQRKSGLKARIRSTARSASLRSFGWPR